MAHKLTSSKLTIADEIKSKGKSVGRVSRSPSSREQVNGAMRLGCPANPKKSPGGGRKKERASQMGLDAKTGEKETENKRASLKDERRAKSKGYVVKAEELGEDSEQKQEGKSWGSNEVLGMVWQRGEIKAEEASEVLSDHYLDDLEALGAFEWPYGELPDRPGSKLKDRGRQKKKGGLNKKGSARARVT